MNGCLAAVETCVETTRKHVSYSQLTTYLACPQKYYYNYVLQVPVEQTPEALVFGKHFHYAVAEYYRHWQKNGSMMPLSALQEAFSDGWKEDPAEIKFKNGNTYESLLEQAFTMLEIFHNERAPEGEIVAVESSFHVPIVDTETGELLPVELKGTFDLVEKDGGGEITLVELKTASKAMTDAQVAYSHQPSLYAYAMRQLQLIELGSVCKVRYDVLTKTKQPKFQTITTTRSPREVQKTIQLVKEILRAIELQVFYRNNGWQCADCQFKTICE